MGQRQKKTQKPPGLSAKDKKSLVKTFIPIKCSMFGCTRHNYIAGILTQYQSSDCFEHPKN